MTKINGILLLDKNSGITSNKALQQVKILFKNLFANNSKLGHTGSLDPLATGMLPICCGEATKFSGFLLNANKQYLVTAQLGIKTDTGDIDGSIIAEENSNYNFTAEQINVVLATFMGQITQIPPMFSAIKQNGVRLYKLARQKKTTILPPPRVIEIENINIVEICNKKQQITLQVTCSKGTYIRSLVEDIANKLNCLATVCKLRRITVGNFNSQLMINISQLQQQLFAYNNLDDQITQLNQLLLPINVCLASLPVLILNDLQVEPLYQGKVVCLENQYISADLYCLLNNNQNLLGVGQKIDNNHIKAKRLVNCNL